MPSEKNVATVNLLKTKLAQAKSVVTADASGLSVNLQRELRQAVKLAGGELIVVKNNLLKLALGAKELLTKEQVEELAQLPTKVELLAKTVSTLNAPITGFVNVLGGNLRKLVYVLSAIGGRGAVN